MIQLLLFNDTYAKIIVLVNKKQKGTNMKTPETSQLERPAEATWEVDDAERRNNFLLGKLAAHDLLDDLLLDA